ncbi:MAG: S1 family peptidase [Pseudonocardiaceae bacterium]
MRRYHRWTLAVTAAIVATVAAQTSAVAQPPDKPPLPARSVYELAGQTTPPPGFRSWEEVMAVQQRLDAAADRIEARRDNAFTGVVVSADQRKLSVYWKDGALPPAAARAVSEARAGVAVQVLAARYSQAELRTEADRVVRITGVTAVSPNADGTGLSVSVAPGTHPDITSNVPITQTDVAAPALASRADDSPPYWGGALWSAGGRCSTGFAIRIGGVSKMLSAGHCAANGNTARDGGGQVMGTVSGDNNAYDRLYINTTSAGRVYNGGVTSTGAPNGEFSNPVIGALSSRVGDYVCTSGSFSGTRCNIQVKAINQTINVGYLIYQTVRAEQLDRTNAVGNGDSGGPVEQVAADTTKVYAKGTITALDPSTAVPCTGVPAGGGRTCAWRIYYVDVINSLNAYGASIITG